MLLHDGSDPRLFPLIDDIIRTSSLAGARPGFASWRRRLLRLKRTWLLAGEIRSRKKTPPSAPRDLLDVIIAVAEADQPLEELVDVLIAFALSISSTGFVLGWVLYLLGEEGDPGPSVPSNWIVLEALRLWPTPWMLGRFAKREHEVAGTRVNKGDVVIACPYLVNRHADYWPEGYQVRPAALGRSPKSQESRLPHLWARGPSVCACRLRHGDPEPDGRGASHSGI